MFEPLFQYRRAFLIFALGIFLGLPGRAAEKPRVRAPRSLSARIESILRNASADHGFWGIEVMRLSDGKVLFKRNQEHLFMPASNMKLFTTAAALEKLGPDYVSRTTVESDASPDAEGRVPDLILVGRGDANLGSRVLPYHLQTERRDPADAAFRDLADQVAARGVREIQGDLIADDTYFLHEPYNHDWDFGDLQWGYGAPISALTFNDNELKIHVEPGPAEGQLATVTFSPLDNYFRVNNHVETTGPGTPQHIFVERDPGSKQLDIWGQIRFGSNGDDDTVSIDDPPMLVGELFQKLLGDLGVKLDGKVKVKHLPRIEAAMMSGPPDPPPARVVLAEHKSAPLSQDIVVTNKVSQNLHAEMLLRTLGHEVENMGSTAAGLDALDQFAARVGIPNEEYYFTDGSGLSRKALVAPEAMVKLLAFMAHSPNFDAYFESLPVADIDGTLSDHFRRTSAAGAIHAKTGTITHVNALSGYMDMPSGDRLAFSIFGNAHSASARNGARAADQIALAIYEQFGGRKTLPSRRQKASKKKSAK